MNYKTRIDRSKDNIPHVQQIRRPYKEATHLMIVYQVFIKFKKTTNLYNNAYEQNSF